MHAVREGLRALVRSSGNSADLTTDELSALQSVADARHPAVGIDPTGRVSLTVEADADRCAPSCDCCSWSVTRRPTEPGHA